MYVHNHCNSKYANYRFCFLISTTSVCNFEGNIPDGRRLGVGMGTASENNVVAYNNYVQVKALQLPSEIILGILLVHISIFICIMAVQFTSYHIYIYLVLQYCHYAHT